ncbi:sulfotransferase family protein [Nonlabens dokdonensis]|uniref:Sulfotransferase n=2 Tax=Nonlabens dokdonensis TaxID=328515 RepID=L7WEV4_NONDD|nr:sulfotransferase [Nonlabens dokdonensis]AGC77403.1 sulfotransferase [Nonlabens dokdonensis DSW-6]PZX40929.1 sulfotransferase family protein [Nonlabens dokdonensis]
MKEEQLVFIVSQPRAGSTFLQNLLSNNQDVNTCSEPWILLHFANQFKSDLVTGKYNNVYANIAFKDYLSKHEKFEFKNHLKALLLKIYEPLSVDHKIVIDKTPRYWEILDEIVELFPSSKVIVLKRDPLDVVRSIIRTWNIKDFDDLSRYKRDIIIGPRRIHEFCIKHKENENVYQLKYEDLITDTKSVTNSLYKWLRIDFKDEYLDTKNNLKTKGLFGDPFQNENKFTVNQTKSKKLSSKFEKMLKGFYNHLGTSFLSDYGNYDKRGIDSKKSISFYYYLHLANANNLDPNYVSFFSKCKRLFATLYIRYFN